MEWQTELDELDRRRLELLNKAVQLDLQPLLDLLVFEAKIDPMNGWPLLCSMREIRHYLERARDRVLVDRQAKIEAEVCRLLDERWERQAAQQQQGGQPHGPEAHS